jgi:hypothetical protein
MIYSALKLLSGQLTAYFNDQEKPGGLDNIPAAVLKNIAQLDEQEIKSANEIMLTLVNLAEEPTMKNNPAHVIQNSQTVEYNNPPVNLNLYILFSVCMKTYEHALIYLDHTITFFQGKHTFNRQNSGADGDNLPDNFHIIMDLYSLSFEQVNYLWSTLGGKQHPFALYKVRMLKLERKSTTETRGVIRQVRIDDKEK